MCRSTDELDSKVSTPLPTPNPLRTGSYPLIGFGSSTEFHPCATASEPCCRSNTSTLAPSEVWSPTTFSQPCGATYIRRNSTSTVTLHPQGFSPSRCLAPRATCRAYFISVPLLGSTLRGFQPHAMPYVFPDAAPLMGFRPRPRKDSARPSRGRAHDAKPEPQA
jgi:hypothetical protein